MANLLSDFRIQFHLDDLIILETDYWIWSVRPDQITLGSSVLSLKRDITSFSHCTKTELGDLGVISVILEENLRTAFDFQKINYIMLMMRDPIVHFHVFPRYESTPVYFGRAWPDSNWPKPVDIFTTQGTVEDCKSIRDTLRKLM